ncbi:hypothetical protein ONS96_014920 [Cadophora gregata f. sp. sojae]|nr:hypothetical protein ONS96_014920 [Cadophora gregata f. sp. sojae]
MNDPVQLEELDDDVSCNFQTYRQVSGPLEFGNGDLKPIFMCLLAESEHIQPGINKTCRHTVPGKSEERLLFLSLLNFAIPWQFLIFWLDGVAEQNDTRGKCIYYITFHFCRELDLE